MTLTLEDLGQIFSAASVDVSWMSIGHYDHNLGLSIWREGNIIRYESVEQGETNSKTFASETAAVVEFLAQLWGSIPSAKYEDVNAKLQTLMFERLQAEVKAFKIKELVQRDSGQTAI